MVAAAVDARQQPKAVAGLGPSQEVFTGRLQAQPGPRTCRDGRFARLPELVELRPHPAAEAEAEAWPSITMAVSQLQVSQHVCCMMSTWLLVMSLEELMSPTPAHTCMLGQPLPLWPTWATDCSHLHQQCAFW